MPNGHGGIPRFGSPVALALGLVALATIETRFHFAWVGPAAYLLAALIGWRAAWHLVMYPIMEYGGAYASAEEMAAARGRYRVTALVAIPLALVVVVLLWRFLR
jgi:hypothetical protein